MTFERRIEIGEIEIEIADAIARIAFQIKWKEKEKAIATKARYIWYSSINM